MIRYVGTIFYVLGLIGALINTYMFLLPSLRSNPCCLFLMAINIVDLLLIHNGLLMRIIQHGLYWDPTVIFPPLCRIRYYVGYVLITLHVIFITLASFERYASTCNIHSHRRRFSNSIAVSYTIFISVLICCIACSFAFPCYTINENSLCTARKGICTTFTIIYAIVAIGFVPPVLTALFTYLTLRGFRNLRRRARGAPISYKTYTRIKQANEQITSMLFMQVGVMSVSSIPYALLMIYQLSTHDINKIPLRIAWEQLIAHFIHLLIYVKHVCSAYIYLATSPMCRQQLVFVVTEVCTQFRFHRKAFISKSLSLSRVEKLTVFPSKSMTRFKTVGDRHNLKVTWSHLSSSPQSTPAASRMRINIFQVSDV